MRVLQISKFYWPVMGGIETVTYLLSGRNEHRDSAGHAGIVDAGGAQWMTANLR